MSVQKDRRIKKLRKKRIWAAVISMCLFIAVFIFIIMVLLGLFIQNILVNKMGRTTENAEKIAQIIMEENICDGTALTEELQVIQKTLQDVVALCVVDGEDNVIMKTADSVPAFNNELGFSGFDDTPYYLAERNEGVVYVDHGVVVFDVTSILKNVTWSDDIEDGLDNALIQVRVWSSAPIGTEGLQVFVENEVVITEGETTGFVAFVGIALVLICIFAVYFIVFIIGLIRDQRQIKKILYLDSETGGNNWTYLKTKGERLIKNRRHSRAVRYALVHVRINKFQSFCTCYGVKEGTELLELIYNVMQTNIGKREIAVHCSRADYAMLLCYESKEAFEIRLEKIMEQLGGIRPELRLKFSMGVFEITDVHADMDAMYNNASIARVRLNPEVGKRIGWYSAEMQEQQLWERKVEDTMEEAMRRKEFQVYLQPKYSSKEEKLSGAEALVRWISPEEGFIPPNRFIPIFEKNGFILKLDDYMISEVARQQAQWIAEGKKVVPISVNVSRAHFTKADLAEHICRLVDQYQVPHEVIELELTESAFFEDKEVLLETVRKFREYGFVVSMDDFGAGYSSLNSLKELPLDVLKLDAEFFRGKEETEKGKIIVNEVICLAKRLEMKTVAEGIETKEQVEFLAEQGCDLIQGYYFAKPMPIREFEQRAFV